MGGPPPPVHEVLAECLHRHSPAYYALPPARASHFKPPLPARAALSDLRPSWDRLIPTSGFRVALRRHGSIAAREFEELAQQAWRDRRDRIDAQDRRAWRADHLIGDPEQGFVAAAEERPDDPELAEHVVEAVEPNERAAHAYLVAMVVDVSL